MAKITLNNIKGFIQGNVRKVLNDFGELPSHIEEQALWRLELVKQKSPECYEQDKCVHCGCQVSAKVFEDRACSSETPCYPKMMTKEQWENFTIHN